MDEPIARSRDGGLDRIPLPEGRSGALWVCGRRVVGPDPEAALARAEGAELIVCLNEEHELREHPDYPSWLRANAGGRALWHPVPDLHAPPLSAAESIVGSVVDHLDADTGVVLHCAGGIGRAPTIAICVLVSMGMALDDALTHVRRHRPMGGPEVGAQVDLVRAFARSLSGR